jgi:hypothetical protein
MNNEIAYALVDAELRLRMLPYSKLAAMVGTNENKEIVGNDGNTYQLEIDVFWDNTKPGDVRVMAAVDDGGWRAFKPLTRDFIMRPDGTFVGESLGTN